jgi:hypothetical protein
MSRPGRLDYRRRPRTPVFVAPRHLHTIDGDSPGRALSLRLRVWLNRAGLDRELAEGANPTTDPARGLRAEQLVAVRTRRVLAAALRRIVRQAHEPPRTPWTVTVGLNRREVIDATELLLALANRLEQVPHACPRAVALASFLVSDPVSPANGVLRDSYDRVAIEAHATTAQLARAALDAIETRPLR